MGKIKQAMIAEMPELDTVALQRQRDNATAKVSSEAYVSYSVLGALVEMWVEEGHVEFQPSQVQTLLKYAKQARQSHKEYVDLLDAIIESFKEAS